MSTDYVEATSLEVHHISVTIAKGGFVLHYPCYNELGGVDSATEIFQSQRKLTTKIREVLTQFSVTA